MLSLALVAQCSDSKVCGHVIYFPKTDASGSERGTYQHHTRTTGIDPGYARQTGMNGHHTE